MGTRSAIALFIVVASVAVEPAAARADERFLLSLEGSFAMPIAGPARGLFGPGGSGSLTVSRSLAPFIAAGLRLRAGAWSDGDPPADPGRVDPGPGSLFTASIVLRLRPAGRRDDPRRATGFFLDVAGGGGLTGDVGRASLEAGAGYAFEVGRLSLAPVARYLHVFQGDNRIDGSDARLVLVGLEVVFFDGRPVPTPPLPPPPRPEPDLDREGTATVEDLCPGELEVVNGVDDEDGCPDQGVIEMVDDRIVLDERVLFDSNEDELRPGAQVIIDALLFFWRQHPEWRQVRIEGHADVRGPARHNLELSDRRAATVRRALVDGGMPADMIDSVAFGEMQPRVRGWDPASHQTNRRVEFVVLSRHEATP